MHLTTIDEVKNLAIENLNNKSAFEPILFTQPIRYSIKLEGTQWDGYVDTKVAQYVIDLQNAFRKLFVDTLNIDNPELIKQLKGQIIVKVRVEEGCTRIVVDKIEKILETVFNNMSGWQKVVAATTMTALIVGAVCFHTWTDYQKESSDKIQDEETKRALIEMLDHREDLLVDLEKPTRGLVNKMTGGDKITLPSSEEQLTKEEAKALYPRRPRLRVKSDYIDGRYPIKDIQFDQGVVRFLLDIGGTPVKANVVLNDQQTSNLYDEICECHNNGETPEIDMHITVKYTSRGIKSASVVGIGPKRENSKYLIDLF